MKKISAQRVGRRTCWRHPASGRAGHFLEPCLGLARGDLRGVDEHDGATQVELADHAVGGVTDERGAPQKPLQAEAIGELRATVAVFEGDDRVGVGVGEGPLSLPVGIAGKASAAPGGAAAGGPRRCRRMRLGPRPRRNRRQLLGVCRATGGPSAGGCRVAERPRPPGLAPRGAPQPCWSRSCTPPPCLPMPRARTCCRAARRAPGTAPSW